MTRIVFLAATLWLIVAAAAHGEIIARTGNVPEQHVSAHAGKVAFSVRRPSGRFVLMVHENGRTTRVPIHSRRATGFDVDLGPGPDGGTVAVYSRCELRGRRRDCDIHQYDFRRRVEEVVPGVNTRRWSEQHPAIWRSRLAFVRRPYGWFEPSIFLAHPGGIRRLRGGSQAYEEASPPRVESIDLVGTRVAFVWVYQPEGCHDAFEEAREVVVRGRVIQRGCVGDATARFPNVALDRRHAYFAYANDETFDPETQRAETYLRRVRLRTGAIADSRERIYGQIARAGSDVYMARRERIERVRPTFVEVTTPTFDE